MKQVHVDYGDMLIPIEVSDTARVIRYGETYKDPPAIDNFAATREALAKPHGMPPCVNWPALPLGFALPSRIGSKAVSMRPPIAR